MRHRSERNNNDEQLKEKHGLDLSGKNEMIFVRNRYQKKLDVAFADIRKKVWKIESEKTEIIRSKIMQKNYVKILKNT